MHRAKGLEPKVSKEPGRVNPRRRNAYVDALRMLARRELSEAQIRQRLKREEHDENEIALAIERLKEQRSIDDARVAAAIARTEMLVKRRGGLRVRRTIEAAGIASRIAREAVDAVFSEVEGDDLLKRALGKRLPGGRAIAGDREFQRLYRYLVGQGHEPDRVLKTLIAKRRPQREP